MTRYVERKNGSRERHSAGLPLSVGSASVPVRLGIATIFALVALIVGGSAMYLFVCGRVAARVLSIVALMPFAFAGLFAAAFVAAPFSRYGIWLDAFVPSLPGRRGVLVLVISWSAAALLMSGTSLVIDCPL